MKRALALMALSSLALAACSNPTGSAPADSNTAAAMPDTSAPRAPDAAMTAPDAGATGAVPSPPPPESSPAATAEPVGDAPK